MDSLGAFTSVVDLCKLLSATDSEGGGAVEVAEAEEKLDNFMKKLNKIVADVDKTRRCAPCVLHILAGPEAS